MPTSLLTTFKKAPGKAWNQGFTMIEMMIVLIIIAGGTSLLLTRLDNSRNQLKSTIREFRLLTKRLHSTARLRNHTLRLVFDLGDPNLPERSRVQKYWVEIDIHRYNTLVWSFQVGSSRRLYFICKIGRMSRTLIRYKITEFKQFLVLQDHCDKNFYNW